MLTKDLKVSKRQLSLIASDFTILALAPVVSVYIHFLIKLGLKFRLLQLNIQPSFFILNIITFILILYLFDQYNFQQDFRKKQSLLWILGAVAIGGIISIVASYLLGIPLQGRGMFFIYCAFNFTGIILVRIVYSILGSAGMYDKRALIIGCGDRGRSALKMIQKHNHLGIKVFGFLEKDYDGSDYNINGMPVFSISKNIQDSIKELQPQILIVAMRSEKSGRFIDDLIWCAQHGIEIWDIPTLYEHFENRIPLRYVDKNWLLFAAINSPGIHIRRLKRIMDIFISGIGLILAFPFMLIIGITILFESAGPIILTQKRIGKNGQVLNLFKFRSMYQNGPDIEDKGTVINDNRITRVGKFIRKFHIDEFPQLLNVLKGDLSMIGPRAELIDFVSEYIGATLEEEGWKKSSKVKTNNQPDNSLKLKFPKSHSNNFNKIIPYIEQRFTVNQGITGWAQVAHPYVSSSYEDMVKKLEYDLYYIKNMSLLLDLIILIKTVRVVILGKGK